MFSFLKRKDEAPPRPLKTMGQKALYGLGVLAALAALAPLTVLALSAVTSLFAAVVVGVALVAMLMALPALHRWWKIIVLKMLKASARLNPVETLQLELVSRKEAFQAAQKQSAAITAARDSLRERLDEFEEKHGVKDKKLVQMCEKLSNLVDRLAASLQKTGKKLQDFEKFVALQADRWKIAKETGELAVMLQRAHGEDVTDQFLADTAIDTIRNELNTSFAEIDQILVEKEEPAILELKTADVVGAVSSAPQLLEAAPVPRRSS